MSDGMNCWLHFGICILDMLLIDKPDEQDNKKVQIPKTPSPRHATMPRNKCLHNEGEIDLEGNQIQFVPPPPLFLLEPGARSVSAVEVNWTVKLGSNCTSIMKPVMHQLIYIFLMIESKLQPCLFIHSLV